MHSRTILAIGMAVAAVAVAPALAQQRQGPLVLTVHALHDGVYWVEGGVANTAFVVGDRGVVAFDTQRDPDAARKELVEIAVVTSKPVNEIIVSHADPDHVGGLPAFPAGTPIIAQENTKNIIQASIADPNGGPFFGPLYRALADFLPTHTVGSTETITLDGVRMVLMHIAPAHTPADLVAYLPAQKIVLAGDIVTTNLGPYPVVHAGGSSLGWIESMKAILALDADTYVPGHGPIETKAMLQTRLRDAEQRRDDVKAMVDQNKSLVEVQQALPETALDPRFLTYTQTIYEELTKGYPPAQSPWAGLVRSK